MTDTRLTIIAETVFARLPEPDAARLYELTTAIRQSDQRLKAEVIAIADALIEARALVGAGNYIRWLREVVKTTEDTAQRLIQAATIYRHNPELSLLSPTAAAALYRANDSALYEVIDLTTSGKELSVREAYVIVRSNRAAALAAKKWEVDEVRTLAELARLARTNASDFKTVIETGWVQPGSELEAVHITAAPALVEGALRQQRQLAAQINADVKAASQPSLFVRAIESPEKGSIFVIGGFESEEDAANALKRLMYGNSPANGKSEDNQHE